MEVAEREREEGDQGEAGDPAASEAFRAGSLAVAGERLVVQQDGFHGGSLSRVFVLEWSFRPRLRGRDGSGWRPAVALARVSMVRLGAPSVAVQFLLGAM